MTTAKTNSIHIHENDTRLCLRTCWHLHAHPYLPLIRTMNSKRDISIHTGKLLSFIFLATPSKTYEASNDTWTSRSSLFFGWNYHTKAVFENVCIVYIFSQSTSFDYTILPLIYRVLSMYEDSTASTATTHLNRCAKLVALRYLAQPAQNIK